jgi:LmbE family N-acetylglucosaminyl deacetylase
VLDDAEIERVLVVTAHPDDVDFGASGTVAGWTSRGVEVTYCVITDGDAGGFDVDVPRSQIPAIRRAEQVAAAAAVGVHDVRFLGYPDGRLTVTQELRADISRVIRQVRPQRLVQQSPERNWERIGASHPDHLAAGEAALNAVYPDARNPFAHPHLLDEGFEAWTVAEVWVMAGPRSGHYVDITDAFPTKLAALRAHASQTGHMGDELEERLRQWGGLNASRGGLPEGRLAESFMIVATA